MVSDKLVRYTPTRIKYFRIVTDQWLNKKYSWHKKILSEKRFPIFFWTLKCYTCCIVKNFVPKKQNNMLSLNKRININQVGNFVFISIRYKEQIDLQVWHYHNRFRSFETPDVGFYETKNDDDFIVLTLQTTIPTIITK